ncbi:MAG TPA: hypothetical protein VIL72_11970 [Beijerinckiaceae bacterium]|jgi:hypothetical protein
MRRYLVQIRSRGVVDFEHEVHCRDHDLWRHIGELAEAAATDARIHVLDGSGAVVAIMGPRCARLLGEMERGGAQAWPQRVGGDDAAP